MPSERGRRRRPRRRPSRDLGGLGGEDELRRALDLAAAGLGGVGTGVGRGSGGVRRTALAERLAVPSSAELSAAALPAAGAAEPLLGPRRRSCGASPSCVRRRSRTRLGIRGRLRLRLGLGDRDDGRGDHDRAATAKAAGGRQQAARREWRGAAPRRRARACPRGASGAGSRRRRGRPALRRTPAAGAGRSSRSAAAELDIVPKRLHRMPPSAWSSLGAAWCRRSTR